MRHSVLSFHSRQKPVNYFSHFMEKAEGKNYLIKIKLPFHLIYMQQTFFSKLEDSLPTNASSLCSSPPQLAHLTCFKMHSEHEQTEHMEEDPAERVMEWLKTKGVTVGEPQEILSQYRSEQKRNIIQKLGRAEGKGKRGLPSLITRRLKSKASQQS